MSERLRQTVRWGLALLLAALAWRVTRDYVMLSPGEALAAVLLTALAVLRLPDRGRQMSRMSLFVTVALFAWILWGRLSDRNLALVGLGAVLTAMVATFRLPSARGRWLSPLSLLLMLGWFAWGLWGMVAERNLVLVGLFVSLTGLLAADSEK